MIAAAYPWTIWAWHPLPTSDTYMFGTTVDGIGWRTFELTGSQVALVDPDPTALMTLISEKLIAVGLLHSDGSRHVAGDDHEDHAKPLRDAENGLYEGNIPGSDYTWESLGTLVDLLLDPSRFVRTRVSTIRELIEHRVAQEQKVRDAENELALAPTSEERSREESIELVTAMVAGAGFELIRDIPGETAMWSQHLADLRPAVQVFLQVTHRQLVDLSPAELYTFIRNQVGAA